MNDSTENTNELDSYGVWVKNNPSETTDTPEVETEINDTDISDSLDFSDALDLPDFDTETDFSTSDLDDIFNDADSLSDDSSLSQSDDTTLNSDELMNITNGADLIETESDLSNTEIEDSFNFDESLSLDETPVTDAPPSEETPVSDDSLSLDDTTISDDSLSLDDSLNFDDSLSLDDAPISDDSLSLDDTPIFDDSLSLDDTPVTEETSSEDEEISLDDFMDGGFSDESVAAGNNGYEPGAPNSPSAIPTTSNSEEISLDDFIDGGFDVDKEKEEEIIDEKPLEMDITFDSSADTVKTETNFSIENDNFDEDADIEESEMEEANTVDSTVSLNSSESFEAEEIDLSDFGIDANAEETPVTQDIEASKIKEQQIDYDLTVENDNTVSAPFVNEIKNTDSEVSDNTGIEQENTTPAPGTAAVDMSLLQQIVADLSNLKDEINSLKSNLNEMKNKEPESHETEEDLGIIENKDEGGFFGSDDTDDTIALSTDELSNIMTSASLSDEEQAEPKFETAENLGIDIVEEPDDETISITSDIETTEVEAEPVVDAIEDSTIVEETPILEDTAADIIEDTPVEVVEETPVDFIEETSVSDEEINFETPVNEDLSLNFTEEHLEEPNIDIKMEENDSIDISENDDLPQEIEIEKDDILVESSSSDFMDSISDSSEPTLTDQTLNSQEIETAEPYADSFAENPLEDFSSINDVQDSIEEIPGDDSAQVEEALVSDDTITEEPSNESVTFTDVFESEPAQEDTFEAVEDTFLPVEEDSFVAEENSFATVEDDSIVAEDDSLVAEEDSFATVEDDFATTSDFIVPEETNVVSEEEPLIEENNLPEEPESDDNLFDSGNVKPVLTDSNINYLTSDDTLPAEMTDAEENSELKKDIKSVLLYMDQLLENLPEDKIVEFAKSEEFITYKKLFNELGLN